MSRPTSPVLILIALVLLLSACGGSEASDTTASGSRVTVEAGDETCRVDRTDLDAGSTTFAVTNAGSQVTEVYVYGAEGDEFTDVVSEVENIGPGTSRDMVVDLSAGSYEVACKPGQTGDGIRTPIQVTGEASEDEEDTNAAGYDREIELTTDGSHLTGLEDAAVGERIEFKLSNNADTARILELKDPSGSVAGETSEIEPGATGELVAELADRGTWQVIVEGDDVEEITAEIEVS